MEVRLVREKDFLTEKNSICLFITKRRARQAYTNMIIMNTP